VDNREEVAIKPSFYNEALEASGDAREMYKPLMDAFAALGEDTDNRLSSARDLLREMEATFILPDAPDEEGRVIPVDWLPRVMSADEWNTLSRGLLQRGRAINAWLQDVYGDGQDVVPGEIVETSAFYKPHSYPGTTPPVHVYGPDLVHLGPSEYVVLEDNARVPSGVAYSEVIRRVGRRIFPELFEHYRVNKILAYYTELRRSLEAAAPEGVEEPNIAVVTRGKKDSAFFEHERLSRFCEVPLLTLDDCYVEGGEVRIRPDGRRLDVMYRRFDEDYVDTDLPGMKDVYLAGRIAFVNAFGAGVADDKAVFPYVPTMIETYLEETPILNNATTYSLVEEETRQDVLDRLPELVLKPREGYGAQGLLMGPEASKEDLADARNRIQKDPTAFVAQECLDFSTHVLDNENNGTGEVFIDLRAFVLPVVGYVMPGGLTRVAKPGTRVVNSSAGGSCKDTWVLEE